MGVLLKARPGSVVALLPAGGWAACGGVLGWLPRQVSMRAFLEARAWRARQRPDARLAARGWSEAEAAPLPGVQPGVQHVCQCAHWHAGRAQPCRWAALTAAGQRWARGPRPWRSGEQGLSAPPPPPPPRPPRPQVNKATVNVPQRSCTPAHALSPLSPPTNGPAGEQGDHAHAAARGALRRVRLPQPEDRQGGPPGRRTGGF